jgi:small-conductance mechanosensitive channel
MKALRRLTIAVPAVALVVFLVAGFLTRGVMSNLPFLRAKGGGHGLVDQRPWQTVAALAPLATSSEEKELAREAERLADHEVDQAFAMALRQAAIVIRTLTGPALELQQKVAALQAVVKEDQAKVDGLTASLKGANGVVADSDDLDVAKAQLQLDTDELGDATEDLARMSGDKRGQIQQELTARQAAMKKFDEKADASGSQPAVVTAKRYGTLWGRATAWLDQRSRAGLIAEAKAQADADAVALSKQHDAIEQKATDAVAAVNVSPSGVTTAAGAGVAVGGASASAFADNSGVKGRVARMAQAHALAQIHSILDDRLDTQKQLSAVYGRWLAQVQLQHSIVTHLILQSLAWIAFLVLIARLVGMGIEMMLERSVTERRRLHTLRTIAALAVQLVTLLIVLLVVFGAPNQIPTILGLATAGLTVVFQDFILAFFGWFVLMGKNGIRVGDWVEINGVGGEVVEIGLFRTALLETGNWTDKGHPTGRRVTFINNFAITGQYFNFSTSGQWMWDEISVNIPPGTNTNKTIDAIHTAVMKETEKDSKLAEDEWRSATSQNGLSQFSAQSSVDMRPAASGVDIIVRYVTRAGDRFEMRNKLYQSVIDLLHQPEAQAAAPVVTEGKS